MISLIFCRVMMVGYTHCNDVIALINILQNSFFGPLTFDEIGGVSRFAKILTTIYVRTRNSYPICIMRDALLLPSWVHVEEADEDYCHHWTAGEINIANSCHIVLRII